MWPFSKSARLIRVLGRLAFYNDKGMGYARHSPSQAAAVQASGLAKVRSLVAAIGTESLPNTFLQAVASGNVATDFTGKYVSQIRAHFSGRYAP